MVLPQCCSQQEKIVDKTQKITELRSYIIMVSFGSNLHFAAFIKYTHFENISIALVDTSYG